jgi:chloride channel protein, CIC family
MNKIKFPHNGIPVSVSLSPVLITENMGFKVPLDKMRILLISVLAVLIAGVMSVIAKLLVNLINLFSNISFHGTFSFIYSTPAYNSLGYFVIAIPAIGGAIVGLIALYGSKAIRGHGIPEAMEQILTNQSKIKPIITFLKPLSAAISIGTGGPFGAEGPIISTGGALGSTIGQLLSITHSERKILLTAGATAGMAAIFGSPLAAIFLAIELLLFEFSPRSIIPVALACITGGAGHYFLFGNGLVFAMKEIIQAPSQPALFAYSVIGILIGVLSVLATKIVYHVEDSFEKLPIHWAWWPAIGGVAVGLIGYFVPRTLGVGYENITDILSGHMAVNVILSLFVFKFVSWAIALGSGTSGGTLAPLLTIGSAIGALFGMMFIYFFPSLGVTISLAALVGMSAMFAGASRAFLTSIVFALETTGQSDALLPLLATCAASYFVSFFLMKNTIMTEKIARRGVKTPDSYEADILEKIKVSEVIKEIKIVFCEENTIKEVRCWLGLENNHQYNYFIISNIEGEFRGVISSADILNNGINVDSMLSTLIKNKLIFINCESSLRIAAQMMAEENTDVIPVISNEFNNSIIGVISYHEIINSFKHGFAEHKVGPPDISIMGKSMKMLLWGKKLINKRFVK